MSIAVFLLPSFVLAQEVVEEVPVALAEMPLRDENGLGPPGTVLYLMDQGTQSERVAAMRAWAERSDDVTPLVRWLDDPDVQVRLAAIGAIRTLVAEHPEEAGEAVTALRARRPIEPSSSIQLEIDGALAAVQPESSDAADKEPVVTMRATRRGAIPVEPDSGNPGAYLVGIGYGGYVGGNIAYIVDEALEPRGTEEPTNRGAITWGALLGAGVGAGTATLLASRLDSEPEQVAALSTGMFVGGFTGHSLASTFIPYEDDGRAEREQVAELAGTLTGAGVALWRADKARSVASNLHLDLATLIGWQTAAGVSDIAALDPKDDRQVRAGIGLAGGLGFYGLAAGLSPHLEAPTPQTVTLALLDGVWLGAWSPYLFTDRPTTLQTSGGLRLGLGAAYLGGVALSGIGTQPSWRSVGLQTTGLAAGSALGAGIPLAIGGDGTVSEVVGPMLGGALAGQVLGAMVSPRYDLSPDDAYLMSTLGAWTAYQTVGWGILAGQTQEGGTRPLGYALTAGGAGTLLTMVAGPAIDVPPPASFQLLASGGWGTWFAGWGANLADLDAEDQLLVTLAGGDAAIVGTAVAEAAGLRPTWSDLGIVNGVGAVGAGLGGLVGVVFLYDENDLDTTVVVPAVAGSAVGLVTGTVLAAMDDGGSRGALALPTLRGIDLRPSLSVRPWADEERRPGVFVELRMDEVVRN